MTAIKPFVTGCDVIVWALLGRGSDELRRLGPHDDVKAKIYKMHAKNPADIFSYMSL